MLQCSHRIRLRRGRQVFGRSSLLIALLAAVAACGTADPVAVDLVVCEGATGPDCVQGSLDVMVSGLPSELNAAVTVSGPNGFTLDVPRSRTIRLLSGQYTVTAAPVQGMEVSYDPETATQVVSVSGTGETVVEVNYVEVGPA